MIVLGPHVVSHHYLLDGDCSADGDEQSCDAAPCNEDSCDLDAAANEGHAADGKFGSCNAPAPSGQDLYFDEDVIHQWMDTRLSASAVLGTIGAPPLSSSSGDDSARIICNNTEEVCNAASYPHVANGMQQQKLNDILRCVLDMATAHADLILTMNRVLDTLSVGTSVRLGLGPISAGDGNGRLVARVEKAWVTRSLNQSDESKSSDAQRDMQCPSGGRPRLAMQKLRNILHRAIIDQAVSLHGALKTMSSCPYQRDKSASKTWEEFAHDMQHSLQMPHVLTLSQLSVWITGAGGFLSHLLSGLLDWQCIEQLMLSANLRGAFLADLKRSSQLARERVAFLHSACPTSRPSQDEAMCVTVDDAEEESNTELSSSEDQTIQPERHRRRQAERMIENLQSTLEAARISLWAFEQSYTDSNTDGNAVERDIPGDAENTEMWWSQFKEMMERSCASIPTIEEQVFPSSDTTDEEAGCDAKDECSEHISGATLLGAGQSKPEGEQSHANKTLVFSGSGIKQLRPPTKRNATSSEKESSLPPTSFTAADQTMLLRDLERRIKTIGLAEEHEVIKDAGPGCVGGLSAKVSCETEAKSRPLFLGVRGSMLADLTSAIAKSSVSGNERVDLNE